MKALDFVHHHYPHAVKQFLFEEWKKTDDGNFKLSYVQKELDLPLPFTGFYMSIAKSGDITNFSYDGKAENIYLPDRIVDKETIKEKFLDDISLDLLITEISNEIYIDRDNQLHLVYQPSLPFYSIPVDGKTELLKAEEEEHPCEYFEAISRPKGDIKLINELIGIDEQVFEKIRELDLRNVKGSVWRIQGVNEEYQDDLSMDGYFHKRNDGTLKMMHDNNTGNLQGVFSFLDRKGDLELDDLSCKKIALQFLFSLYPAAEEYFSLVMNEENIHFHYEFRVFYEGMPIRFSSARISVNKTTGTIDHYMARK